MNWGVVTKFEEQLVRPTEDEVIDWVREQLNSNVSHE